MSGQAKFYLSNKDSGVSEVITADLLDTAGVVAWKYAVTMNNKERSVNKSYWTRLEPYDETIAQTFLNKIYDIVDFLSSTHFAYTDTLPVAPSDVTREWLNKIHRHFTNSAFDVWSGKFRFESVEAQYCINDRLLDLNSNVHNLEHLYINKHQQKFQRDGQEILVRPKTSLQKTTAYGFDIKPYMNCHSRDHHDVVLDPYILGKTIIQSFLDIDDPSQWDTTGHVSTDGGCMFVLTDHRQKIYQSSEYVDWLAKYNLNYYNTYADFPIGDLIAGDKQRLTEFVKSPNFNHWNCAIELVD
jgi:hypothetical protein